MAHLNYTPPPTLKEFMQDPAIVRWVIGPLGSGKTMACLLELFRRAVNQAPDSDGVRPTRFVCVRNTLPQLRQTVLNDIKNYLGPLITYKVYENTVYFDFPLSDGTRVQSEWLLTPIDTQEDTRKLLSLQITGAFCEEFRELDYEIVAAILGRCGRYPSAARVKPTWQGLLGSSNPFPLGSVWHEHLVLNLPKGWAFYQQPGGMTENAENRENLPDDYYERLMEGHTDSWIDVHVHGQFGPDQSGKAVFHSSFDYNYHTGEGLQHNTQLPLMLAMDFGRTPACLFCQEDTYGRLLVLEELTGEDMGLELFVREKVRPKLVERQYTKSPVFVVGDPAGAQKSQVNELAPFDILRMAGFHALPAITNNIDPRIRSVETLLLQNRGKDKSALLIDRRRCPLLVRAMSSEYKFKRLKTGRVEETPCKDHPWSDVADALQYACLSVNAGIKARAMMRMRPRPQRPKITAAAWT